MMIKCFGMLYVEIVIRYEISERGESYECQFNFKYMKYILKIQFSYIYVYIYQLHINITLEKLIGTFLYFFVPYLLKDKTWRHPLFRPKKWINDENPEFSTSNSQSKARFRQIPHYQPRIWRKVKNNYR